MASEDTYKEFVGQILRPTNLTTLRGTFTRISILIFRDPSNPTEATEELEFEADALYPFNTIQDLCTQIYIAKEQEEDFHPSHQCLLIPLAGNPPERPYVHFQYIFDNKNINLQNPYQLFAEPIKFDKLFVDLAGNSRNLKVTSRLNTTLQTALFQTNAEEYVLHLYLYRDLYNSFQGPRPMSPRDFAGKLLVYFPEQEREFEDGRLSDKVLDAMVPRVTRFVQKHSLYEKLQGIVEEGAYRKLGDVDVGSFRNLRLGWRPRNYDPRSYSPFRIDELFYDMPLSILVPYIRYYPKSTTPISKVYVEDMLNRPAMDRPEILTKWAQESSLTPQQDMIMLKFLIRPGIGSINPIYGTLFIFHDASAKVVIQPNMDERSIPIPELDNLGEILDKVMGSIPKLQPKAGVALPPLPLFTPKTIELEDAYIVLSLELDKGESPLTYKSLKALLPFYKPFFQVTESPIKEASPLFSLRYKAVDNFLTPSRDFQFIARALQLQNQETGRSDIPSVLREYIEEFDVTKEVAESRIAAYLRAEADTVVVNSEIMDVVQKENPGIDIAIFGRLLKYTVHLYRVDSVLTLQTVKTLVSTFVSTTPASFSDVREAVDVLEEEEVEETAEVEAAAGGVGAGAAAVAAPAPAAAAPVLAAAEDKFSNAPLLGDFDSLEDFEFGMEEPEAELVEPPAPPGPPMPPLATLAKLDAAPEAPKKKAEAAAAAAPEEEIDPTELKLLPAKSYFLKRLQMYDRRLFMYKKVHPSDKDYAKMCAGNALKQPIVISESEYARMKKEYEKEIAAKQVVFVEYPLAKGEKPVDKATTAGEVITTLRYGSSGKANIYICCMYWCRYDEIVLLSKDYTGTKDRKGGPKPPNTCPFCKQGPVKDRDRVVKGESVVVRKDVKEKSHLYVGFLKKSPHPENLFLPCCFTRDHVLHVDTSDAFKITAAPAPLPAPVPAPAPSAAAAAGAVPEPAPAPVEEEVFTFPSETLPSVGAKRIPANYTKKLESVTTSYILGAEKLPLEITTRDGPQIGVCPAPIDTFFAQKSIPNLVKQNHTVWKLVTDNIYGRPNVSGFFRIAAENRTAFSKDSLLAAVAPYYGLNSAEELKRNIQQIVSPSIFLGLNYGNFLFDFYNPDDPPPNFKELKDFASKQLLLASGIGVQKESLIRCYKAYQSFLSSLSSIDKRKEYRQYASLFTQPNLIATSTGVPHSRGILFIVLEVKGKEVEVRCPPYGVTEEMVNRCDIGFLSHYPESGIWEPLFYTKNNASTETYQYALLFTQASKAQWPEIVKQRVEEYKTMCKSSGLGLYTDFPNVNSKVLLPLSVAVRLPGTTLYGILRDVYNHVSSLLYLEDDKIISVPVIDDGTLYPGLRIELDWRNYMLRLAPANQVRAFYTEKILPLLASNPARSAFYKIGTLVKLNRTVPGRKDIYAFELGGGLFIPVKKSESEEEEIDETEFKAAEGKEPTWILDTKLVFGKEDGTVLEIDRKDFEEIYQHLRLTFSNWLSMSSPEFKKSVMNILFKDGDVNIDLPLYEKRQRLFILFGNEVLSWLDSTIPQRDRKPSIKRIDCRITGQAACSNRCVWKEDTESCLLHVPSSFDVGGESVDAKRILLARLIDELIRFPEKRSEIMKQQVSQYQVLRDGFRSGNEYIVPENTVAWTELLRMEWRKKGLVSAPKYVEEYTMIQGAVEPAAAAAVEPEPSVSVAGPMPDVLATMFGERAAQLYFIPETSGTIYTILAGPFDMDIETFDEATGVDVTSEQIFTSKEFIELAAQEIKSSIVQLAYEPDNPLPPEPLVAKGMYANKNLADVLFLVQLPDGTVGSLSTSPDEVTLLPIRILPGFIKLAFLKTKAIPIL